MSIGEHAACSPRRAWGPPYLQTPQAVAASVRSPRF